MSHLQKPTNVESFHLDHTKVKAPYVRRAGNIKGENGDMIYKYDIRFVQPNVEHMEMPVIHSLEHLLAENIRNYSDKIIDLSPMGCQTGFYLTVINFSNDDEILNMLEKSLKDVLKAKEIPAANKVQCGFAASHDLKGAQNMAQEMLAKRNEWTKVFG